jgi:hypothetical protein
MFDMPAYSDFKEWCELHQVMYHQSGNEVVQIAIQFIVYDSDQHICPKLLRPFKEKHSFKLYLEIKFLLSR